MKIEAVKIGFDSGNVGQNLVLDTVELSGLVFHA